MMSLIQLINQHVIVVLLYNNIDHLITHQPHHHPHPSTTHHYHVTHFIITQIVQQNQHQPQQQQHQNTTVNKLEQASSVHMNDNNPNNLDHRVNSNNHSNDEMNQSNNNNNNNNINNINNNNKRTEGILASPSNPATLRRLSQTNVGKHETNEKKSNRNEVSWHKRVVVHRVPRSDASRSMFHAKGKESNNSSQCCIVL